MPIGFSFGDESNAADFAAGLLIALAGGLGWLGKKLLGIDFWPGGFGPGNVFCALPKPGSFGLLGPGLVVPVGNRLLALLPRLFRPSAAAFFKFAPAPPI